MAAWAESATRPPPESRELDGGLADRNNTARGPQAAA